MPVSISGDGAIGGLELGAFEDVSGTPTDNQALTWDAATSQWVPETVTPTSLDASVIDSGVLDAARIPDVANAGIGSNVVQAFKTNGFSTTSNGFASITGLSVSITPSSASSKILVIANVHYSSTVVDYGGAWAIYRNGSQLPIGSAGSNTNAQSATIVDDTTMMFNGSVVYLDSPATISAVTYNVRIRRVFGGHTTWVNRSGDGNLGATSSITAIEVAA